MGRGRPCGPLPDRRGGHGLGLRLAQHHDDRLQPRAARGAARPASRALLGLDGGARLAGRGAARQPSVQRCRRRAASAPQHAPWAAPACALRPASAARAERLHLSAAGESGAGVPGAFGAAERASSPPGDQAGRAPRQGMREKLFGGAGFVPDIPWLQAWLECAWRSGVDTDGSNQLGGAVQGSHAWIGTTEAAALLRQFGLRARIVDVVGAPPRPPARPCHLPFLGGTSPERCVPSPAVYALLQRAAANRLECRPRHAQRSQLQHVGACAAGAPRKCTCAAARRHGRLAGPQAAKEPAGRCALPARRLRAELPAGVRARQRRGGRRGGRRAGRASAGRASAGRARAGALHGRVRRLRRQPDPRHALPEQGAPRACLRPRLVGAHLVMYAQTRRHARHQAAVQWRSIARSVRGLPPSHASPPNGAPAGGRVCAQAKATAPLAAVRWLLNGAWESATCLR